MADYSHLIAEKRNRLSEINAMMAEANFYSNQRQAATIIKEERAIKKSIDLWETLQQKEQELAEANLLAKDSDNEIAEMAKMEIPDLSTAVTQLQEEVQYALLPQDPNENRDALVEIRAGAGGDEASLFAQTLLKLYERFAEKNNWKVEHLSSSLSDVGGFKEVVIKIKGDEVFRFLKYESGVHRVQRIPTTETQGRVHTSTVTVAVMPEAEKIDVELLPEELHIQATRSGGPGGQHVNTTDSAVQITHLPTGIQVKSQEGRSQTQNKERGMEILRAKIFRIKQEEEAKKYSDQRRSQIGSGDRSEKIRTYNFPQSRVTDHRINFTSHNLENFLDGNLTEVITELQKKEMADRISAEQ